MHRVSNKRRRKEKRGSGYGADYKPWLKTTEVPSQGTRVNEIDYKTGRIVELMSMAELYFWHLLRWDLSVVDIREQFPLDNELTKKICRKLQMMHPGGTDGVMTTDFLTDFTDGTMTAFSVKSSRSALDDPRTVEKLYIEKTYWGLKGVPFAVLWGEDLNMVLVRNIMDVVRVRQFEDIFDEIGIVKYMVANHIIEVDMGSKRLDWQTLVKAYKDTEEYECVKKKAKEQNSSEILRVNFCG